ncbi:hypothetical protein Cflav_PD0440 [Pedosphaera parvula Ellin514]|uniref:Uncharacterized protein n=1 Tax=Pedosphaera parvula (strain Ellin514) TaxID=320771 RepID=B9XRN8_PEDPL|nr:hypothetical protein Cflav_PD0440 [Pedosphaera parvula Ellin514]
MPFAVFDHRAEAAVLMTEFQIFGIFSRVMRGDRVEAMPIARLRSGGRGRISGCGTCLFVGKAPNELLAKKS